MKNNRKILWFVFVAVLLISCKTQTTNCEIKTTEGSIFIVLYPEKAPNTVANFLQYVDKGLYEQASFFRVCNPQNEADREIKIEVIQGGLMDESKNLPPIQLETTEQTGIKHLNGVISMARDQPHSATNSFFICIADQPELDFEGKRNPDGQGFAAFGKVTSGMDIVRAIQKKKDTAQYLINPVIIESIVRVN